MNTETFMSYDRDILRSITPYLKQDEHIFISGVSSIWKKCYLGVKTPRTSYTSIIESKSRIDMCLNQVPDMFQKLCDTSCVTRNIKAVKWLCTHENFLKFRVRGPFLGYAAAGGEEILDYIIDEFKYDSTNDYIRKQIRWGAVYSCDIFLLDKYSNFSDGMWTEDLAKLALTKCNMDVITWALHNQKIDDETMKFMTEEAAMSGNIQFLKAMHEKNFFFDGGHVLQARAARKGNIDTMIFLCSIGCTIGPESYIAASSSYLHTSMENTMACLELIEREIGTSCINWLISTVVGETHVPIEVIDWFRQRE